MWSRIVVRCVIELYIPLRMGTSQAGNLSASDRTTPVSNLLASSSEICQHPRIPLLEEQDS